MQPADANTSFSRDHRIKSTLQIQEIVTGGQSVFAFPIKCYYRFVADCPCVDSSLAVVVPKRRFRRAVDRNRLKRLMREAYRHHKFRFPETFTEECHLQMCWVYVANEMADYETVVHAVSKINQKIQQAL
ncbi:MAG: ribonuclease P protein component [Bacteroidales bacterium]|nr:ribonuclease P protein component [Bacteroidales bacterium]